MVIFGDMDKLIDRINKIEELILRASTEGERQAALSAKDRILEKYPEIEFEKEIKEFTLYTSDEWHKKLLLAICRKYELEPYRYQRQKYTTVMVKVNEIFLRNILWKEYLEYSKHLEELVTEITDNLISQIYTHQDEKMMPRNLD